MANLPANRTKLNVAIANQQPSIVASAQANREALVEAYDTIDLLYEMVNNLINTGYLSTAMVTNLNMNTKQVLNSGNISFSGSRAIQARSGDVLTIIDFEFPELVNAVATLRMFRATNTTGNKDFIIHNGDGTSGIKFRITNGEIITLNGQGTKITAGAGSPEGVVSAGPGSLYLRTDGTFYVKQSGSGNTGWKVVQVAA